MGIHRSPYLDTVTSRDYWHGILTDHPRGAGYTPPVFEAMVSTMHSMVLLHLAKVLPDGLRYSPDRREVYYPVGATLPSDGAFCMLAIKATSRVLLGGLDALETHAWGLMGDRAYVIDGHSNAAGGRCRFSGMRVTLNHLWRYPERSEDTPRRYPCPFGCDGASIIMQTQEGAIRADIAECLTYRRPNAYDLAGLDGTVARGAAREAELPPILALERGFEA